MIRLSIDNKEIETQEGTSLLQACLDNRIYIPNLCYVEGMDEPPSSCRLCLVEIEGQGHPVTSCSVKVKEGMVVKTDTPSVRRLQCTAFKLLMSVHDLDCAHCPANKRCALQQIARFLKIGLNPKPFELILTDTDIHEDHPLLNYYPNRCVLCGKCIYVCRTRNGQPLMSFAKRGFESEISLYGEKDMPDLPCKDCLACVEVCPVGAITLKENPSKI